MNEKMIKMFGYFIAAFVVLIIIIFMISSCSSGNKNYEDYENKMVKAAKNYYTSNKDKLPNNDTETKKMNLKNLISSGLIKEASEYFDKDTITCDGTVTVYNNNNYYQYIPHLTCKDDKEKYETKSLIKEVTKETVTAGLGLYEKNGEYVFKGDTVNNYVRLNGKDFRIISINQDETIRLVKEIGTPEIIWDEIFNPDYSYESGLNEFEHDSLDSGLKKALKSYYESDEWTDDDRSYFKNQTLCIGKRSEEDVTKDGSTECSKKIENQYFGLLTPYEFLRASLDTNCSYTIDQNCTNYNWMSKLNKSKTHWSITANSKNTKSVYAFKSSISVKNASGQAYMNVVINIDGKVPYSSGDGSKNNPYIIGYDSED